MTELVRKPEQTMHFLALAADFDGTLAHHGSVEPDTVQALKQLKETGRRLVLVTGREMADLRHVLPERDLFNLIVAENGGVVYDPNTGREPVLAPSPPARLVQKLMERKVEPISVGRTIVATWLPHDAAVLSAIEELGLELEIIFNKGAVMVLPTGVNKATGLKAALEELGLSPVNVVAVGDAENDHAFLKSCGCSAAVANALPAIKDACDIVLTRDHGAGVAELITRLIPEDAHLLPASRLGLLLGVDREGEKALLQPQESMLIAGGSGSGKSSFVTRLTERMIERRFEFCVIDPEGEYANLEHAVSIGDDKNATSVDATIQLLRRTGLNVVVSTLAIGLAERRRFFADLLPCVLDLRATTGRPHWLIVEEAHHFLPRSGVHPSELDRKIAGSVLITVEPKWLPVEVLRQVDALLAFGSAAPGVAAAFAGEIGLERPATPKPAPDEALFWSRASPGGCRAIKIETPRQPHERHKGKYAIGDVGEEHSFYFCDETGRGRRARNLSEFIRLADEVQDAAWEKHLHTGDFAAWFVAVIRDEELARHAREIANDRGLDARQGRSRMAQAIRARYVIPE
jgi:HAD superfamily hydrolase (TIGR01484 family)